MITLFKSLKHVLSTIIGIATWTIVGAALLAPIGALAGGYYAAIQWLFHGAAQEALPRIVHATCCAAAAGAILGAFIRICDGENPFARDEFLAGPGKEEAGRRSSAALDLPPAIRARQQGLLAHTSAPRGDHQEPSLN
jgi:hypothetical protein